MTQQLKLLVYLVPIPLIPFPELFLFYNDDFFFPFLSYDDDSDIL